MVDGDGLGEEGLYSFERMLELQLQLQLGSTRQDGGYNTPSTMPSPDLRIGTMDRACGCTVVVVYSNPIGVSPYAKSIYND